MVRRDTFELKLGPGAHGAPPLEVRVVLEDEGASCGCMAGGATQQLYAVQHEDFVEHDTGVVRASVHTSKRLSTAASQRVEFETSYGGEVILPGARAAVIPINQVVLDRKVSITLTALTTANLPGSSPLVVAAGSAFENNTFVERFGSQVRSKDYVDLRDVLTNGMIATAAKDKAVWTAECVKDWQSRLTPAEIGRTSLALQDVTFCCPSFVDPDEQWVFQDEGEKGLAWVGTSKDCAGDREEGPPICQRERPHSPYGRFCVERLERDAFGHALCVARGLQMLPPGEEAFDMDALPPMGRSTLALSRYAVGNALEQVANLGLERGPFVTAVDQDGDHLPNRFDLCVTTPEPFQNARRGCQADQSKCRERHGPDENRDCRGDMCPEGGGGGCVVDADCPINPCVETAECSAVGQCVYSSVLAPSAFCDGGNPWDWSCAVETGGHPNWTCHQSDTCEPSSVCSSARCEPGAAACVRTEFEDGTPCSEGAKQPSCQGTVLTRPACHGGQCTNEAGAQLRTDCSVVPQCWVGGCEVGANGPGCVRAPAPPGTACQACEGPGCDACAARGACSAEGACEPTACPAGQQCNPFTGVCQ